MTPKSGILFKNLLVSIYMAEWLIIRKILGLLEHVYMLNYARHFYWPPVKGHLKGCLYFGNEHKTIFSQTTGPSRIKFGMKCQGNEALSYCAPHQDALSL